MKIYNTLTRNKDELKNEGQIKIYACGPTVYNFIHIGNARPLCVFDVLRRYFEWRGYKVNFVQNFTDIDDKMIKRANAEGITVKELGERFIAEYFKDAEAIGVKKATVHPKATENIEEALSGIYMGITPDAVNVCIDCAIESLSVLTGEKATETVVTEVFKNFCVGK